LEVALVPGLLRSLVASVAGRGTPQTPQEYLDRGVSQRRAGKPEAAIADLTRALELDPALATAFAQRALARNELGQQEAAITDFTQAIELDGTQADPYFNRGLTYLNLARLEAALADFTTASDLTPGDISTFAMRGEVKRRLGDAAGAIADLEHARSIATDRKDFDALEEMIRSVTSTTSMTGLPGGAPYQGPGDAGDLYNEGNDLVEQGGYEAAIAAYTKAIERDPAFTFAFINRSLAQQYLGRLDLALADMTRAVELEPGFALAYYTPGQPLRRDGRERARHRRLRQVHRAGPDGCAGLREPRDCPR
jgi:tetratricopeptide (TPR) repeat protein